MSMKSEYGFYMQQQNALKASGNGRFLQTRKAGIQSLFRFMEIYTMWEIRGYVYILWTQEMDC